MGEGRGSETWSDELAAGLAELSADFPEKPDAVPRQTAATAQKASDVEDETFDMGEFSAALDVELADEMSRLPLAEPAVGRSLPAPNRGAERRASARPEPHPQSAAYASWVAPKPRSAAEPSPPKPVEPTASRPADPKLNEQATNQVPQRSSQQSLQDALNGLSAPALPRNAGPRHAQPFAPERVESMDAPEAPAFDDFEKLIATELAAMRDTTPRASMTGARFAEGIHTASAASVSMEGGILEAAGRGNLRASASATVARNALASASVGRGRFAVTAAAVVVAGSALVYFAGGSAITSGSEDVLIVAADSDPVKVRPQDPGGRSIPNQHKAVYERVQSPDAVMTPSQQRLVSAAQEPAQLPREEPSSLPGVDLSPVGTAVAAEIRDEAPDVYAQAEPEAVLTPRRVRTLTVLPDGTLVPAEASEAEASEALIPAAARPVADVSSAEPAVPSSEADDDGATIVASINRASTEQVSSADPASSEATLTAEVAASFDGWYVQISSQPSREAAEESSNSLGQRYASVLGGHDRVIQSADIPGRGTYWRVRLPVETKDEANRICGDLKSAGGSCFVAR